ncbi:MAG TPA: tetratricopeptide repeat protein [Bryobacteraceae bacterium]|nr:tetratricopeptide repeat protein [Bryobacteraceae bacterium]
MFWRFIVALLCAATLLLGQNPTLEHAWDLAANGRRDEAIQVAQKVVERNPQDVDARLLLGSLLVEKGDRIESIAQLVEAVRLRPESAEAQNALGEAYRTFGDAKAALAPFQKAVAIKPAFGIAQENLGAVMLETGNLVGAAAHLDRAIQLLGHTDDAADAHYLRAKVYSAHSEVHKAAEQLEQAVSIRPDFPEAWSDLGDARRVLLDAPGSIAALQRAVQLKPAGAVAQYRLGAEYLRQEKVHLAVEHLEAAYRINPDDQSTLNSLQTALREDGQMERAATIKRKLVELLRKRDEVNQNILKAIQLNNEGAALQKQGNLAAALEKYRDALNLNPKHVGIRVNYAVALLRLGRWTEGLTELHDALLRDPGDAQIRTALNDALRQAPPGSIPQWSDVPVTAGK